jgi:radical SAM protein with 4Fe4S-binding SPASM domain
MELSFPSRPLRYELELTTNCMNRCSICGDSLIRTKGVYMKEWKAIVDKIKSDTYNSKFSCSIRLTGGEPTLHPEFYDIVKYIDDAGIEHGLFTTGCFDHLDTERFFELYANCKHFSSFLISLHGATDEVHTRFTARKGSFDEACKYIRIASENGFVVVTNSVLTNYSVNQIKEIADFSESLGTKASLFERLFSRDGSLEPSDEQLVNSLILVDKLRNEGKNCVSAMCLPRCFAPEVKDTIKSGFEIATISTLGEVRPSNLTPYSFGNILNDDLETIWNSEKANKYRLALLPQCHSCPEVGLCRGGIKFQTSDGILSFDKKIGTPATQKREVLYQLNKNDFVSPNFQLIKDTKGNMLACHSSAIFISEQAVKLIQSIDGKNTVQTFHDTFGNEGVKFLSYLHMNHFIRFTE